MNKYTPKQYIKIAIANAYGLDGLLFPERISWVDRQEDLYLLIEEAKEPYQYIKAIRALEDTENGVPTGYAMGLDCTSSGAQLMSILIGCPQTARQCNVINTGRRENMYQNVYQYMLDVDPSLSYTPKEIKNVGMTVLYASKAEPKKLFGLGKTLELFNDAMYDKCPGALELMSDILSCRDPSATGYKWTLPDAHTATTVISMTQQVTITVPELDNIAIKHLYSEVMPNKRDVALVSGIVHSVDGYVVREAGLRANHDKQVILNKLPLLDRLLRNAHDMPWNGSPSYTRFLDLTRKSDYSMDELLALKKLVHSILEYPPFEMYVVHDKYFSSPIHTQKVREMILDIYIELARSDLMSNILNEITGEDVQFKKRTYDLADHMTDAEYIIC